MTNQELNAIENIIRNAKKGLQVDSIGNAHAEHIDIMNDLSSCADLFMQIYDEAEKLLPENHRFLLKTKEE